MTMAANETSPIAKLIGDNEKEILPEWIDLQKKSGGLQTGRIGSPSCLPKVASFCTSCGTALLKADRTVEAAYAPARDFLTGISRSRALQGFSPNETATFVFSLKQPLFNAITADSRRLRGAASQR